MFEPLTDDQYDYVIDRTDVDVSWDLEQSLRQDVVSLIERYLDVRGLLPAPLPVIEPNSIDHAERYWLSLNISQRFPNSVAKSHTLVKDAFISGYTLGVASKS